MTECRPPHTRAQCGRGYRASTDCHGTPIELIKATGGGKLDAIVRHYRENYSKDVQDEMSYFGDTGMDLAAAIARACASKNAEGKLCSHQWRVGHAVLAETVQPLLEQISAIRACTNFDELHDLVEQSILRIDRVGLLTVYDISQRIGWYLGLSPEHVYLHAGVRKGARALGLDATGRCLATSQFPIQLQRLSAAELEDVLCLYKDCF